jgi:hypothetical protein
MENFGTEYGGKPFADECKSICHALGWKVWYRKLYVSCLHGPVQACS